MTGSRPLARPRWGIVAALLALAVVVRASAMFYGSISPDDATVALMAKHVLSGENFPAFFYRQTYMGSLNGIHLVPALYLFGPSTLLVRLNAIAWSLLLPLGLYHLGRRIFGEPTGLATLALAAVPPFLLVYWSTVAEPHFETNVFGVWLLLLALAAVTAPTEPARTRTLVVFGLLGGLALWTNVKALVILVPALALLALRAPRALLGRGGLSMAGGFALGTMPAWLFYLVHGDRAGGTPGSVANVLGVNVDLSTTRLGVFLEKTVMPLMGTYYWESWTRPRWAGLAANCAAYALAVGLALGELVGRRHAARPIRRASGLALLLLTLAVSLGAAYVSEIARRPTAETSRYALPAYIPLLVLAGALVARVSRRSRPAAAGLLAFLLLFAGWTSLAFLWPLSPSLRARESAKTRAYEEVRRVLATRPVEALYVDETFSALVWAFLLDRPTVSALTTDIYVPSARAADAASRISILAVTDPINVERGLAALGATSRQTTIARWRLFEDVLTPARAYRMAPRTGWRVAGDQRVPASVADGDLGTAWPPPRPDGPRDVVVDLGRPHEVARLIFWPSLPSTEVFPLALSASVEGTRWESLGTVPTLPRQPGFVASGRPVFRPRNGWLELVMAPRLLRYVRIEPEEPVGDAPWGISELHVYGPERVEPPPPISVEALLGWLRGHQIQRLLADPVVSARVDRAMGGAVTTLIANGVLDNHGEAPPSWLARPLRLRAGDALLVPIEDVPELRERLEAAHTQFLAETIAGHALVRVVAPLASPAPCIRPAGRAVSRGPGTQGGVSQVTMEARLDDEALVSGVRLWHPTTPGPTAVQVAASRDGRAWQPLVGAQVVPAWGWAGRTLFTAWDPLPEVVFDPVSARHVRVIVTPAAEDLRILCVRGDAGGARRS